MPCTRCGIGTKSSHAGLRVVTVAGDAFHGGLQQRNHPALTVGVGWWGGNPDDLLRFGFHQKHQVERWRVFADGLQQKLLGDNPQLIVASVPSALITGAGIVGG